MYFCTEARTALLRGQAAGDSGAGASLAETPPRGMMGPLVEKSGGHEGTRAETLLSALESGALFGRPVCAWRPLPV